jgi:hypothetical protein
MGKYFAFKTRPAKTTDRLKLIPKVDAAFSEVIRMTAMDQDGYATCITCGDSMHWTDMDCGHYMIRKNMATRWHLQNCHPQCRLCNSTHDGKAEVHALVIDRKYGAGTAAMLEKLSRTEVHISERELQDRLAELKQELKALREEKLK